MGEDQVCRKVDNVPRRVKDSESARMAVGIGFNANLLQNVEHSLLAFATS